MCKRRSLILVEIGALGKERKKVRLDGCMGKLIQFIKKMITTLKLRRFKNDKNN